jgi:glycosyltransferase involved in cell wall biosynthesis
LNNGARRKVGIDVIIPTRNEEKNIANVIYDLKALGYDNILVVDANSEDRTVEIAKELGANVIFQQGMGKGAALREAFLHDLIDGDIVVMMDADGSMSAKEIPHFVKALDSGADLVKGSRFLPMGYSEDLSLLRRFGNHIMLLIVNAIWGTSYTDLCYGFGAFRKSALAKLNPLLSATNFEIETEICIKAKKLNLKVFEVPSVEFRRNSGKSKLSTFGDGFRILKSILTEIFIEQ